MQNNIDKSVDELEVLESKLASASDAVTEAQVVIQRVKEGINQPDLPLDGSSKDENGCDPAHGEDWQSITFNIPKGYDPFDIIPIVQQALKNDKVDVETANNELTAENVRLENALKRLKISFDKMTEFHDVACRDNKALSNGNKEMDKRLNKACNDNAELKNNIQYLDAELTKANNQNRELKFVNDRKNERFRSLEQLIHNQRATIRSLKQTITQQSEKIALMKRIVNK